MQFCNCWLSRISCGAIFWAYLALPSSSSCHLSWQICSQTGLKTMRKGTEMKVQQLFDAFYTTSLKLRHISPLQHFVALQGYSQVDKQFMRRLFVSRCSGCMRLFAEYLRGYLGVILQVLGKDFGRTSIQQSLRNKTRDTQSKIYTK